MRYDDSAMIEGLNIAEAHRALELLEEYNNRLSAPQHRELREAIDKVINLFKTNLFQALLDIQEYYDDTLANERKSVDQKTYETNQIAARWENNGGPMAAFRAVQVRGARVYTFGD